MLLDILKNAYTLLDMLKIECSKSKHLSEFPARVCRDGESPKIVKPPINERQPEEHLISDEI
jgi:hypothetical protein